MNSMNNPDWEHAKALYTLGKFVQGTVEFHAPFGVFISLDETSARGLIKIPDFLDEGDMEEAMYPDIRTTVGAVVVGYNESNCCEVYLSAKPSVLHRALVHLKMPSLAV